MPSSSGKRVTTSAKSPLMSVLVGHARGRNATRFARIALSLLTLLGATAAASGAETRPSANMLFQFQKDNQAHPWLRITSDSGRVERRVLRLDRTGLNGLTTPEGLELPDPIAWGRIQRIDEVVTRAHGWKTAGVVTLGLLGAGLGNAIGAPSNSGGRLALVGAVAFGSAGGYLGSRYGSRFRSERNWYVADTTHQEAQVAQPETVASAPAPAPETDPEIVSVCNRMGADKLFRATGTFGSFQGFAGIAGPEGLQELRADHPPGRRDAGAVAPTTITWDQVDRIDMRGGAGSKGALIGGSIFAALGAMVGAAAVAVAGDGATVNPAEGGFVGAITIAPVGIVLGALVGSAGRHWVTVYQRP